MREVLFPKLLKLRADDELVHGLAAAARRDKLTLSEFAPGELRSALAAHGRPASHGRDDDPPSHSAPTQQLSRVPATISQQG